MKEKNLKKPSGFLPLVFMLFLLFVVALFFWLGLLLFLMGCRRTQELPPLPFALNRFVDTARNSYSLAFGGIPSDNTLDDPQITSANASALQAALAEQVLRLHIIADSNSDADQNVKLTVRDAVITYLKPYLEDVTTKQEALDIINEQMDALTTTANRVLAENGFSYTADARLGSAYFPVKLYGDLVLPAGEYDALKICLGSASGKNWWCLIFPQLCFVDVTTGTLPEDSKEELRELLTEEEFALVFPNEALYESAGASIRSCQQTCRILFDHAPRESKKPEIRFILLEQIKKLFSW
ncbi:MAG: stage II sporulation protein R [Lachnospiraceae bacterium]|nr:stage II sporulation protein R [Lachnospiraceae bacterium]